jgi:DNA-binding CsgD family transcriptional regulator
MVLVDLEAHPAAAPRDLIIEAFGLAPAEARLAARLAAGNPIEIMAEKLGITYETAHNVMKSISFSQIETRRQGELIALLAQLSRRPRDTEVLSEAGQLVI